MSKYLESIKRDIAELTETEQVKELILQQIVNINDFPWSDQEKLKLIIELSNIGLNI